jgi:crotonobetainyl-CoA:carnitine CoA-transferase CaiB-like acyl-CoA transferase
MLSPYRVLDLTDEKGLFCAKLLGDLGADVIKVEKPGGDPVRNIGPFYLDEPHPEKSLYWFALNSSKRGITLNIESTEGQEIFKRLVKTADFIIESYSLGYLESLGLGYSALETINPGLIVVSIMPFGPTGPYKDFKTSDIVAWAMGGHMHRLGDADRPPVRVSYHFQSYLNAGAQASVGALVALNHRAITGEGQQVVVSIQEAVARTTIAANWDQNQICYHRGGLRQLPSGELIHPIWVWACKDGEVIWYYSGGERARERNQPLIQWMDEEGFADDFIKGVDWEALDLTQTTQEFLDRINAPTIRFFMAHTKAELYEGASKRRLFIYPVSNVADVIASPQLIDRGFWTELEHAELGTAITYPGAFTKATEMPPRVSRRAPLIGEHNHEIYEEEFGFDREEMIVLQNEGTI